MVLRRPRRRLTTTPVLSWDYCRPERRVTTKPRIDRLGSEPFDSYGPGPSNLSTSPTHTTNGGTA